MSGTRTVRFDHLIGVYAVGSGDWSWRDEYEKLISLPVTQKLIEGIRTDGIREPVLLGNDGRVWDGHHRVVAAMHLGLDEIPIEFSGGVVAEAPEWEYGVATKWGVHEHPHLAGAERYAADVRAEIEQGRASGDLAYHGRVMKRTKAKAGPWVPVKQEGAEQ